MRLNLPKTFKDTARAAIALAEEIANDYYGTPSQIIGMYYVTSDRLSDKVRQELISVLKQRERTFETLLTYILQRAEESNL